jgi:hypothetical protein
MSAKILQITPRFESPVAVFVIVVPPVALFQHNSICQPIPVMRMERSK